MKHRTRRILVRAWLVALVAVSACSERQDDGIEPPPPPPPGSQVIDVTLANFAFAGANLTIDRGTTVRWRNSTATFHTVTPDGHAAFQEWQTNAQNQTFEFRFDQPGTYRYFCAPHRAVGMTGVITVR